MNWTDNHADFSMHHGDAITPSTHQQYDLVALASISLRRTSALLKTDVDQGRLGASASQNQQRDKGTGRADRDTIRGNTRYKALGGDDVITVKKSDNTVLGGRGNDVLNARKGRGNNLLNGGKGDDILIGGGRDDVLVGGGGADAFVIAQRKLKKGTVFIQDFKIGEDSLIFQNVRKADALNDVTLKRQGKTTVVMVGRQEVAIIQGAKGKRVKPNQLKNNDAFGFGSLPDITISNATIPEGTGGTNNTTFAVTLSKASTDEISVDYAIAPRTATAGADYTPVNGTVTFAPGTTSQTISVPIVGDAIEESAETFVVNLDNPKKGAIATSSAIGTIIDDDGEPTLSISDVFIIEGNTNSTASFTVTLNPPSPNAVTVNYSTANGTATAGSDYTPVNGTLTFNPNTTTQTITVPIFGGDVVEADETFFVNLTNPVGAPVSITQAVGTILNDDVTPPPKNQRRGKKIEKPSAQPDFDFEIFDVEVDGTVILDEDERPSVGVFTDAIESFRFNTQGTLSNDPPIWSDLTFDLGNLTATRTGDTITYLFSSNAVKAFLQEEDQSFNFQVIEDRTFNGDALVLTVDLTSGSSRPVPVNFDAERAVNDLEYIIENAAFQYSIAGTAYGGTSVDDISFFPNLCPPDDPNVTCDSLEVTL
ncbi:MAG: Calx-beta domain-containing protein [Cyanobacteria bacterium P01_A01_bin.37]